MKGSTRQAGRCGDSAVAVSPTTSRKMITRTMRSGSSTSIGAGGAVAGQKLADQPDGEDRHQHQADAVDGRGEGAVALAGLGRIAAPEAAAQEAAQPPQRDGQDRPDAKRREVLVARAAGALRPSRPHAAIAADERLHRRRELRPELAPRRRATAARASRCSRVSSMTWPRSLVRRSVQLVGAGDDHLALLDLALADRRLVGQPGAIGLHRVGFRRRVGARLDLERRQKLLGVGEVVAGDGGGGARGGAHVGCLLAQRVDLGRQQVGLLGPGGDAVELARPQTRSAGRTAAAAAPRSGPSAAPAPTSSSSRARPGGGDSRISFLVVHDGPARQATGLPRCPAGPSCSPERGPKSGRTFRYSRTSALGS